MLTRWRLRLSQCLLAAFLIGLVVGGRASAQVCVGDCSGRGAVGINDLILAVNIVLGQASLDDCPSLGSGPIGIAELIASVANALCECEPCPEAPTPRPTSTHLPSETPTASPTPTSPPSATPTVAVPVSRWHEDQIKVTASSCPKRLVSQLRQALAEATADYRVYEQGADSAIEDATSGARLPARIDDDGVLSFDLVQSDSEGACTVTLTLHAQVDVRHTFLSTATYTGGVRTMSCPNPVNCSLKLSSRWEKRLETLPSWQWPRPCDWPTSSYNQCRGGGITATWSSGGSLLIP
jgi:hypothetical protein